jgi:hypothetical protein
VNTTIVDAWDIAAYRAWTTCRVTPANIGGMPTWVWQSALCRRPQRPRSVT